MSQTGLMHANLELSYHIREETPAARPAPFQSWILSLSGTPRGPLEENEIKSGYLNITASSLVSNGCIASELIQNSLDSFYNIKFSKFTPLYVRRVRFKANLFLPQNYFNL